MNSNPPSLLRSVGFWLALLMLLAQLVDVVRVGFDPAGYARYFGLPLDAGAHANWVQVYALRKAFVAALVGYLMWTRQLRTLGNLALLAMVMPMGDLYLVWQAGAPDSALLRHAVIGFALLPAGLLLRRDAHLFERA